MKSKSILIIAATVAASNLALTALAQNSEKSSAPPATSETTKNNVQRANDVIGMDVRDTQDHRVGKVGDLLIDLEGGRIAEVILRTGHALPNTEYPAGNGEFGPAQTPYDKLVAVPPGILTYDASGKFLRIDATAKDLEDAPMFKQFEDKEAANKGQIAADYNRYHVPALAFGIVRRATSLMGEPVENDQAQKLGKVRTFVVDIPGGRVVEVIISSGGFLGMDTELTALMPQSFSYDPATAKFMLNMSPESLKSAPHFKADEWRNSLASGTGYPVGTVGNMDVPATGIPNSTVNQNEVNRPPSEPVMVHSDADITSAIQQKITAADGLSSNARAVQVTTLDGKVTLRGTVDTEYDRQKVGELAASVVSADKVDNQLVISTASVTSMK